MVGVVYLADNALCFLSLATTKTNTMRILPLIAVLFWNSAALFAQCEAGETEVSFLLLTDPWGYENYWELVPSGTACGEGAILSGGNGINVGCDGDGNEGSTDEAYESNTAIEVGPVCLTTGASYDFIFVDSYGDGGLTVQVFFDGILATGWMGTEFGNTWTFEVGDFIVPEFDSACGAAPVMVDGDTTVLSNTNAVALIGEISPGGGSCGANGLWCEGSVTNSVWASFVAPESGLAHITTCNDSTTFDTQLAVYGFGDCSDQSTFSLMGSNDDMPGGCSPGHPYSSEVWLNCLTPGDTYLLQIDGYNGASGDVGIAITDEGLDEVTLSAGVSSINCAPQDGEGADTGAILSWVTGWSTSAAFSWTGPDGYTAETAFIDELQAGTYELVVTNACGNDTLSESYEIVLAAPFDNSISTVLPECPLSTDGSILVEPGGATPPYSVQITGPDEFESDLFDNPNLSPGSYQVLITDDFGCEYEELINLPASNAFTFSLGEDPTICSDETLLVSGPPGYLYEWNTGSVDQFLLLDGAELGVGTYAYILNAYNPEGCEHSDAIIVTVSSCTVGIAALDFSEVKAFPNPTNGPFQLANLPALSNATLDITDTMGRRVWEQRLDQPAGTGVALDLALAPGTYQLRITDAQGHMAMRLVVE